MKSKHFKFWWSSIYEFFCIVLAFCVLFKTKGQTKVVLKLKEKLRLLWFSCMFCFRNFIVLTLSFSPIIHLIFYVSYEVFCFFFLHIAKDYSSTICWTIFLFPLNCFGIFVENQLSTYMGIYFWSLLCLMDLCVFTLIYICLIPPVLICTA